MSKPALRLLENPFNRYGEFDVEIYLTDKKFYRLNLPELRHLKVDCGEVARNTAINFLAEFIKNHPGLEKITLSNLRLANAAEAPLCAGALKNLAKAIVTVGVINNQCKYPELQIDGINNLPALISVEIARAKQEGYMDYKLMKEWQEKAQEAQVKLPSLALRNPKAAATDKKAQVKLGLTFKIKHNRYCDNSTNFAEICPSENGKDYAPEIPQKVTNLTIGCKGYDHLRVLDFLCEFVKKNTQLTKIIISGLTKVSREEEGFPSQSKALLKMAKAKKFHDLLTGEDLTLEGLQLPKLCERDIKQINIAVAKERAGSKLPPIEVKSGGKPFKNSQLGSSNRLKLPPIRR